MTQTAVSPTLSQCQFNHFSNVLLSLELGGLVILAHMLYECLHVAAYRHVVVDTGAQYTRVASVWTTTMTLYDKAIRDLETPLIACIFL